jgi:ureidoglycolate lyase
VNYARNTWHAVLTPLGEPQDFLVVDRGGAGSNLEEFAFPEPWTIELPEAGND